MIRKILLTVRYSYTVPITIYFFSIVVWTCAFISFFIKIGALMTFSCAQSSFRQKLITTISLTFTYFCIFNILEKKIGVKWTWNNSSINTNAYRSIFTFKFKIIVTSNRGLLFRRYASSMCKIFAIKLCQKNFKIEII